MPSKTKSSSTGQKMPPKLRLKLANDCENLLTKVILQPTNKEHKFHLVHSKQIDESTFNKLMTLFESLMKELYEKSSWGWNKDEKSAEWKHSRTRIVIVTKNLVETDQIIDNKLPSYDEDIIGFMCFRFEIGADKNESALYVYEIHIDNRYQRQGLGEELMRMAQVLANEFKMDKIMLTSFRSNLQALQFYNKLNFLTDKSSPAKNEADYVILSRKLKT